MEVHLKEEHNELYNPIKKWKLGKVMFLSFTGFMALLLAAVMIVSYFFTSAELIRNTSHYQRLLLKELSTKLSIQLDAVEQASLVASRSKVLQQYLSTEKTGYERHVMKKDSEKLLAELTYSSLLIESVDLFMSNPPTTSQDFAVSLKDLSTISEDPLYANVITSDFTWIGEHLLLNPYSEKKVVSFSRKLYSNMSDYLGVLMIHVNADELLKTMTGEPSDQSLKRQLWDFQGNVILSTTPTTTSETEKQWVKLLRNDSGSEINENVILSWNRLPDSYWYLVELTPYRQMTEGSLKLAGILAAIGLTAVVLALLYSFYLSKQLSRPIRRLLQAMGTIGVHKTQKELLHDYTNEFGALFNGYRQMNYRIIELYHSLEEQYRKQKAVELDALQSMINPHFLYNTLDQINWMAIEEGQDKISSILELTGKMLRIGLSNGETYITVREELVLLECYVGIQSIRSEGSLTFHIDVPATVLHCYLPKLTLQPFVENAVIHGFHGKDAGSIHISACEKENKLLFLIRDDGVGISESMDDALKKTGQSGGYGLRNVQERLDVHFGASGRLSVYNTGNGTEASITIPVMRKKPEEARRENDVESRSRR
ncbi:sensor histidine kinase [Paenibacillus sp. J5C_2022]|nr:sensor histidine kinase [Paenibacillus sp. J5C2022]